jgi:hypothetical protein
MLAVQQNRIGAGVFAFATFFILGGSHAAVTWQVQSDYRGTSSPASQARSLRGLALSDDDSSIYTGFIQGTSSSAVRKLSSGIIAGTIAPGDPDIQGEATIASSRQPKGVATDDRGNVYATLSLNTNSTSQQFRIYNSTLTSVVSTTVAGSVAGSQFGGMAVQKLGSDYYLYLGRNGGQGLIERWNVTNPAVPVLDTTWASSGILNLKTFNSNQWPNAFVNGLDIASDGTIYAAGGILGTGRGDSVFRISPDGSSISRVDVATPMDVVRYGNELYVSQYLGALSTVAVLSESNLNQVNTLTTGFVHGPAGGTDSGYAGIDVAADGRLYLVDQIYDIQGSTLFDRVLVSSPVPEPAMAGAMALGSLLLVRRRGVTSPSA